MDIRLSKLAYHIIDYSCKVKSGNVLFIQVIGEYCDLVDELVRIAYERMAVPYINQITNNQIEAILKSSDAEEVRKALMFWADVDRHIMEKIDCYVEILNDKMLSDINSQHLSLYKKVYYHAVHWETRLKGATSANFIRWTTVRYPSNIIFSHCDDPKQYDLNWVMDTYSYNYAELTQKMNRLATRMAATDKVKITCGKTNLIFSIKKQPVVICDATFNIPDGEVSVSPCKYSANGILDINVPSWYSGHHFKRITLEFEEGRVANFSSDNEEGLKQLLNIDTGARYIGEFAFGTNPIIDRYIGNIIFDEKRLGTVHFALGNSLGNSPNGNVSAIHWDLILDLNRESEITFDSEIVMKDGMFCQPDLIDLNCQNVAKNTVKYVLNVSVQLDKVAEGGVLSNPRTGLYTYFNDDMVTVFESLSILEGAYSVVELKTLLEDKLDVDREYSEEVLSHLIQLDILLSEEK